MESKSSDTKTSWVFSFSSWLLRKASGYSSFSSFLNVKLKEVVSIFRSLPTSENTTSPSGSFLTISDSLFELTRQSPSTSTSTLMFDLIVMSKSDPIISTLPSPALIYRPLKTGVEGLGFTTLEAAATTSLISLVFVLNFTLFLYIFNSNKGVCFVET